MKQMTVKRLREIISQAPEDAVVLIPSADHEYRDAYVEIGTAHKESIYTYCEDHGELYTPEAEFGPRIMAVIIS